MTKTDKILADGREILQGFTPQELEAFRKGAMYGAANHREINRKSEEWYERHNAGIEAGKRDAKAFCEHMKGVTGLGKAVDNIKNMKTYEEVRDEVLEKLIHGLAHHPEQRKEFMDMLRQMDKQDN